MQTHHNQITQLLLDLSGGNRAAVDALMPLVYEELRQLAHRQLRQERQGHTLNTTALVHEAYLKLIDQQRVNWQNRAHFFALAAQAMRRILINYANNRLAQKRGGGQFLVTFNEQSVVQEARAEELVALDEALSTLAKLNARQSQVVEFQFFGGLRHEEIAEVLGVSVPTVRRDWRLARAWLSRELVRNLRN
ncbi:sigma-70 family RNA polymerase sigma factor [candidate division KSB1 bacterium]|nr:sigma-70 family RNA polymerase sigma factor [candidate division KSB1 bacterium]